MKRIASVLAAGALGTATAFASAALMAPGPVAMTRTSGYVVDAAVPSMAVTCASATQPVVALSTAGHIANKIYAFSVFVNGVNTSNGYVRATTAGLVQVRRAVPNLRISLVQLKLSGTSLVYGHVAAYCGAVPTTTRGSASSYALYRNSNGTVTRWNPCDGVIRVKVNPTGGGTGALGDAETAIRSVALATGLNLVYDGTTTFIPRSTNSSSQPAPIVISWASPTQTDYYGAGAIGEGGWRSSGVSTDGVHWTWKITKGFVVVDPAAHVAAGYGRGISRGALLLHELGHVVGLAHTSDTLQVMSPVLNSTSYASYGYGDRTALINVGATKGCVPAA